MAREPSNVEMRRAPSPMKQCQIQPQQQPVAPKQQLQNQNLNRTTKQDYSSPRIKQQQREPMRPINVNAPSFTPQRPQEQLLPNKLTPLS